ncbi:MAG: hypothetical protein ACT4QF_08655 [Sporichthyaceae bacterium]
MPNHLRIRWDEDRGDGNDWGASTWWFEIADGETVLRQVEVYDKDRRFDTDRTISRMS